MLLVQNYTFEKTQKNRTKSQKIVAFLLVVGYTICVVEIPR